MKKKIALSLLLCVVGFGNHVYAKWSAVNGPYGANVTALAKAGNNIYAGTYGGGMFRSVDNGITWIVKNAGLTDLHITAIAIKDKNVYIGTKNGVCLSPDSGASWREINTGLDTFSYSTSKSIVYLAFVNDTLFTLVITGYLNPCYGGAPIIAVFFSLDDGVSWHYNSNVSFPKITQDSSYTPDTTIHVNTVIKNGNAIIFGTTEGIYLSQDNGATWMPSSVGMSCPALSLISYNSGKFIVCSQRNTFMISGDGSAWVQKNNNLPHTGVTCLASVEKVMFAGTDSGVFALANSDTNWEPLNNIAGYSKIFNLFSFGHKLFATAGTVDYPYPGNSFFVSNTMGKSWATVTIDSSNYYAPVSFVAKGTTLYAFTYDCCILYWGLNSCYISSDLGFTWTKSPISAEGYIAVVLCNNNIFGLSHYYGTISQTCPMLVPPRIFILKPADTAWAVINFLSDKNIQNLASLNGNLFAATGDGVFLAPDKGTPWTDINDGLGDRNVRALAFSDKEIFAATEAGLWHRPLSEIPLGTIQKVGFQSKMVQVGMSNNHIFKYTLPRESYVSLEVYDVAGRLVCSIINAKQFGGSYSIAVPVGKLRSGNYFFKFTAGEFKVQKKFVILR